MYEAQKHLHLEDAWTLLVDAGNDQWGGTLVHDDSSFFRTMYNEIEVWKMDTGMAASRLFEMRRKLDYVHVDANHAYRWVRGDFLNYSQLLNPDGVMTFHDTKTKCGVPQMINELREDVGWDIVNFPDIGAGFALVRRRH
jgi:hypothetical protein